MPADCTAAALETVLVGEPHAPRLEGWPETIGAEREAFAAQMRLKREAKRPAFPTFADAAYVAAITAATKAYDAETDYYIDHCVAEQFRDDNISNLEDCWLVHRDLYEEALANILALPSIDASFAMLKVRAYFIGLNGSVTPKGEIEGYTCLNAEREFVFTSLWRDMQALEARTRSATDQGLMGPVARSYCRLLPTLSAKRALLPPEHLELRMKEACVQAALDRPSSTPEDLVMKAAMVRAFFDNSPPKFRDEMEDLGHRMAMTIVDDALRLATPLPSGGSPVDELPASAPDLRGAPPRRKVPRPQSTPRLKRSRFCVATTTLRTRPSATPSMISADAPPR